MYYSPTRPSCTSPRVASGCMRSLSCYRPLDAWRSTIRNRHIQHDMSHTQPLGKIWRMMGAIRECSSGLDAMLYSAHRMDQACTQCNERSMHPLDDESSTLRTTQPSEVAYMIPSRLIPGRSCRPRRPQQWAPRQQLHLRRVTVGPRLSRGGRGGSPSCGGHSAPPGR